MFGFGFNQRINKDFDTSQLGPNPVDQISENDKFYILESLYNMKEINFDSIISYYGPNSKNVIKHSLFLNKNLKSVKNSKFIKENIKSIVYAKK